jgi:hypothetical protein
MNRTMQRARAISFSRVRLTPSQAARARAKAWHEEQLALANFALASIPPGRNPTLRASVAERAARHEAWLQSFGAPQFRDPDPTPSALRSRCYDSAMNAEWHNRLTALAQ